MDTKQWIRRFSAACWVVALVACGGGGGDSGDTVLTAPIAPSGLSVTNASAASLTLRWTDASDNETVFQVERSSSKLDGFGPIAEVAANQTEYIDTGLSSNSSYYYRVRAANGAGPSGYTAIEGGHTLEMAASAPVAPNGLVVGDTTSNSLRLSWVDRSNNEAGFIIERGNSATGPFNELTRMAANSTSHLDTGLTPATTYFYRVRAFNSAGESANSAVAQASTDAPPLLAPAAPTSLLVGSPTSSSLTLTWQDNSNNEAGFKIERSVSAASGFIEVAQAAPGQTSHVLAGLNAATTYYLRVRAFNAAGDSTYSPVASGTTLALPALAPIAPTNLTVSNITGTTLRLNWVDNSANETGFRIERSSSATTGFEVIATVPVNTTVYPDRDLDEGSTYYYRVRGYNSAGPSDYTNTIRATTTRVVGIPLTASNCILSSTLANHAQTAYPNCIPTLGINTYSTLTGFPNTLAAAAFVKFDVSSLSGKAIESATLQFETLEISVGNSPRDFFVAAVAGAWSASTLTWDNRPDRYYVATRTNLAYPRSTGQTYSINVQDTVQAWVSGSTANDGFTLQSTDYTIPGNVDSWDIYKFGVPTLTVRYR